MVDLTESTCRLPFSTLTNPNASDAAKANSESMVSKIEDSGVRTGHKDPSHVVAGLKSATHNPNVSAESKAHASEMFSALTDPTATDAAGKDPTHIIGGLKPTRHNPNASTEAKEHAQAVLELGVIEKETMGGSEPNPQNVEAGLKAALYKPDVSEVTKGAVEERLENAI
ncbi:MAG: hypothetical protein Q9160_006417 [Pyrenula sp. 1 TL-2023]